LPTARRRLIALDIGDDRDAGIVHGMIKHFRNAPTTRNTPIVLLAGAALDRWRSAASRLIDSSQAAEPLVLAARVQRHLDLSIARQSRAPFRHR
jgi:hypothetical protein